MDTSTAPTASNSRAVTPLMPEKEPGAAARLSRTETLTVASTHDEPKPSMEKNNENSATADVEPVDESTILTGRKLFLVFVYVTR